MDVFIGEIRAFAFNWAPEGWLPCNGGTYSIQQYQALATVLGQTYGGSGNNFQVPNLQGRVLVGTGALQPPAGNQQYQLANVGGAETVEITISTVPPHSHIFNCANTAPAKYLAKETKVPANGTSFLSNVFEHTTTNNRAAQGYNNQMPDTMLAPATVTPFAGGGAEHNNQQPYLVLNYCINWDGYFPLKP